MIRWTRRDRFLRPRGSGEKSYRIATANETAASAWRGATTERITAVRLRVCTAAGSLGENRIVSQANRLPGARSPTRKRCKGEHVRYASTYRRRPRPPRQQYNSSAECIYVWARRPLPRSARLPACHTHVTRGRRRYRETTAATTTAVTVRRVYRERSSASPGNRRKRARGTGRKMVRLRTVSVASTGFRPERFGP